MNRESRKGSAKVSKMELAKALKSIRDTTSDEDYKKIRDILVTSDVEAALDKAIKGLSEEDEFALMCRLMRTATYLVRLDQRPIIPSNYIPPDFLAKFQPGCAIHGFGREGSVGFKCLIEVKSTEEKEFKPSHEHDDDLQIPW